MNFFTQFLCDIFHNHR